MERFFEFIQSKALSRDQLTLDRTDVEVFNVHYGDIHATYEFKLLDFEAESRIPKIICPVNIAEETKLKDGDLIIADVSEDYDGVGDCVEVKNIGSRTVTGGLHTFVARDKSGLTSPGFRAYILKNHEVFAELKKLATGSKVFGISKTNLEKLQIHLPSISEQKKIAEIFNTWDIMIGKQTRLIAAKEKHKRALMQKLLTGEVRFKGFEDEWDYVFLSDVANFSNGKAHEGSVADIGDFILVNSKFISSDGREFKFSTECLSPLSKGTIVMVMSDVPKGKALAKCFIIPETNRYTLNQRICAIVPFNIDNIYLYYVLNRNKYYLQFDSGVGQTNLKKEEVLNCPVWLPKLEEQKKIAAVLYSCDYEISLLKKELDAIVQQKKGLMQNLLTGQIRVNA